MAEAMAVETRKMRLDGRMVPAPGSGCLLPRDSKEDSAAVGAFFGEAGVSKSPKAGCKMAAPAPGAGNEAAARRGIVKAASWSDFETCVTKPGSGNRAAVSSSIEPPAEELVKTGSGNKAAAAACKIEPAAKQAKSKADEAVMKSVMVPDAYIKKLQGRPPRRPFSRLSESTLKNNPRLRAITAKADAEMQALIEMEEDIINQYRTKGHAIVQVKEDVLNYCRAKGYKFVEVVGQQEATSQG